AAQNLILQSEALTSAAWSLSGIAGVSGGQMDPLGGGSAFLVRSAAGGPYHMLTNVSSVAAVAGEAFTGTFWGARGSTRYAMVGECGGARWQTAVLDFDTGTIVRQTNATAQILHHEGDWYQVSVTSARVDGGRYWSFVAPMEVSAPSAVYTADGD